MTELDIKGAFLVLQGVVSMTLPDARVAKEIKQREQIEAAIGAAFQLVEGAFIDLHRLADALEMLATNGINIYPQQ